MAAPYEPSRSAVVIDGDLPIGIIGEFRESVRKSLKLPDFTAGFELLLPGIKISQNAYKSLPKFPKVQQDITLKTPSKVTYAELFKFVEDELNQSKPEDTLVTLSPVDIYQDEADKSHKNFSFRLWLSAYNRTLKAEEVNKLLDEVALAAKEKFDASRL